MKDYCDLWAELLWPRMPKGKLTPLGIEEWVREKLGPLDPTEEEIGRIIYRLERFEFDHAAPADEHIEGAEDYMYERRG